MYSKYISNIQLQANLGFFSQILMFPAIYPPEKNEHRVYTLQNRPKHPIPKGNDRNLIPSIWVFPKIGVPQNGWFIMENPIKMDDLGVPLFLETPIYFQGLLEGSTWITLRCWDQNVARRVVQVASPSLATPTSAAAASAEKCASVVRGTKKRPPWRKQKR